VTALDHGRAILSGLLETGWWTDGLTRRVGQVAVTEEYRFEVDA
jgi:hypothetical protein